MSQELTDETCDHETLQFIKGGEWNETFRADDEGGWQKSDGTPWSLDGRELR